MDYVNSLQARPITAILLTLFLGGRLLSVLASICSLLAFVLTRLLSFRCLCLVLSAQPVRRLGFFRNETNRRKHSRSRPSQLRPVLSARRAPSQTTFVTLIARLDKQLPKRRYSFSALHRRHSNHVWKGISRSFVSCDK
jgi:hypothetical protein